MSSAKDGDGETPRAEHAWTNDVCMICKEAAGPFPVLNPKCSHGYCPRCLYKKQKKMCDLCLNEWKYRYHGYNTPWGSTYVVRLVDGGHLLEDDAHFFVTIPWGTDGNAKFH